MAIARGPARGRERGRALVRGAGRA